MRHEIVGRVLILGALAGLAGGSAEVVWVSIYAAATGTDATAAARGVTDTIGVGLTSPVAAGVAMHMTIAAVLGMCVAAAFAPMGLQGARLYGAMIWFLAAVWAVNFILVLPLLNPNFVAIVPLGVSFVSKLLFGVVAAACLQFSARDYAPLGATRTR
jgi:hypothetical protein